MTGPAGTGRLPGWAPAAAVLALVAALLAGLAALAGSTLPDRTGPPIEELAVERVVLHPGTIELTVRNAGPDPVQVAQVAVNDGYVDFSGDTAALPRLRTTTLRLSYPWQDGQPYLIALLTSTGVVVEHEIPAAVATPEPGAELLGTMALLGAYVGILPVLLGMLLLPLLRRAGGRVIRGLLAFTVGLLAFLAADATLEAVELAARGGGGTFGGPLLVLLAAGIAFLALAAIAHRGRAGGRRGYRLALMIAIGIGLHNLGEGLAIGSAYAVGELALGAGLVVGFALHNTTEGVAVVTPLTTAAPTRLPALLGLGLVAGAPAVLGAVLGATVAAPALSAVLLGVGVGAIVQVIVAIAPALRDRSGRLLDLPVVVGLVLGVAVMYLTGLLVAV